MSQRPSSSRPRPSRQVLVSALLLVVLLVAVGLLLALFGSLVSIPQGGVVIVGAVALSAFLGLQVLVFRTLGLRSRADDVVARRSRDPAWHGVDDSEAPDDDEGDDDDADWRAWRG